MGRLTHKTQAQNQVHHQATTSTTKKKERNASAAQKSRERTKVKDTEQQAFIHRLKDILQTHLFPLANHLSAADFAYIQEQYNFKVDIDASHPHLKLKRPAVKRGNRQNKYQHNTNFVKQEQPTSSYPSRANTPFSSPSSPVGSDSSGTHSDQANYTLKPTRSGRNGNVAQQSYTAQTPAVVNQILPYQQQQLPQTTYASESSIVYTYVPMESQHVHDNSTHVNSYPVQNQIPVYSADQLAGNDNVQYYDQHYGPGIQIVDPTDQQNTYVEVVQHADQH